jgi:hypothetical protein
LIAAHPRLVSRRCKFIGQEAARGQLGWSVDPSLTTISSTEVTGERSMMIAAARSADSALDTAFVVGGIAITAASRSARP